MEQPEIKHILIRLPNWLGDIIMSLPFLENVKNQFPQAAISVIIKKEYAPLLNYVDGLEEIFPFERNNSRGFFGLRKFGLSVKKSASFDLFFSLPDSFSSAIIGYFSGAKIRLGYKGQWRNIFLTSALTKPTGIHRAEEYNALLEEYIWKKTLLPIIHLNRNKTDHSRTKVLLNINSEAQSRRMPISLANAILRELLQREVDIYLTGGPRDVDYVSEIEPALLAHPSVKNWAGKSNLTQLFELVSDMDLAINTDSGIAHVSNAFQVPTVVLFGAGNEANTAPVNKDYLKVIRLPGLPCAPCLKNTCRFGIPMCLSRLDAKHIVTELFLLKQDA